MRSNYVGAGLRPKQRRTSSCLQWAAPLAVAVPASRACRRTHPRRWPRTGSGPAGAGRRRRQPAPGAPPWSQAPPHRQRAPCVPAGSWPPAVGSPKSVDSSDSLTAAGSMHSVASGLSCVIIAVFIPCAWRLAMQKHSSLPRRPPFLTYRRRPGGARRHRQTSNVKPISTQ